MSPARAVGRTRPPARTSLPSRPAPRTARSAVVALLLVVTGLLAYANGLEAPFLWDDETAILKNESIRRLGTALSPPPETPLTGRPLPNLSLAVNYAIGGIDPAGYHAWNLGVAIVTALLLFGIVRRTLARPHVAARYGLSEAAVDGVALFAALWWLLHPLVTETVDYVTQRTESMMGALLLLTLYASIRADERRGPWWAIAAVAACAAGMATKETMVVAPLLVALYDLTFGADDDPRARLRARAPLYAGLAASWLVLAAVVASATRTTAGFDRGVGPWTYALNQTEALWRYATLVVWPRGQVLDYGLPRALTLADVAGPAAFVVALLAALVVAAARRSPFAYPLACALLTLAPTSSVLPIVSEVAAERRMYVPLAAIAPCVAFGGWWLSARAAQLAPWGRAVVLSGGILWLVLLGAGTVTRNREYRSPLTIWASTVERRPHGRARLSYAIELISAGRQDDAIGQLREAVTDYPRARYALGTELAIKGDYDAAIAQLVPFVAEDPTRLDRIPARRLLGRLYLSKNQPEASLEQFKALLALSPNDADAHASLGDLYASMRRYDEAEASYRALVAARPNSAENYMRLASMLIGSQQPGKAVEVLERASQLSPDSPEPHLRLAEVLVQLGRPEQALERASRALAIAPTDMAHNLMGVALASNGRVAEALEHFRTAVRLAPNNQSAQNNLARAERLAAGAR